MSHMEEKDFLGLKLMSSPPPEVVEDGGGGRDSVHNRGSGAHWAFSKKVSAMPHFMSYKAVQEERGKKALSEHLASPAFMPVSTTESLDINQSKGFTVDLQRDTNCPIAAISVQQVDGRRMHHVPEEGMFHANNSFFKTHGTASGNSSAPTIRKQSYRGISETTQLSYAPNVRSVAGFFDQRPNSTMASPQLTIFYGGSVSVFDDISPEKAKAIMHLAGNMTLVNSNTASSRTQMQDSNSRTLVANGYHGNQSRAILHHSGPSSHALETSQGNVRSGNGSNGTDESLVQPKSSFPSGSFPATMVASAVPQARKASLARFLEKRKERVMNSIPYSLSLKSPDYNTTPGSRDLSRA